MSLLQWRKRNGGAHNIAVPNTCHAQTPDSAGDMAQRPNIIKLKTPQDTAWQRMLTMSPDS